MNFLLIAEILGVVAGLCHIYYCIVILRGVAEDHEEKLEWLNHRSVNLAIQTKDLELRLKKIESNKFFSPITKIKG